MSTPFSDGIVQPMDAPPMPVSPHGEATRLRSERALWERRAAVAADAMTELDSAVSLIGSVGWVNYFGDCVEGQRFHKALQTAIAALREQLSNDADSASQLGRMCVLAGEAIDASDRKGAADIAT